VHIRQLYSALSVSLPPMYQRTMVASWVTTVVSYDVVNNRVVILINK